MFFLEVQKDAVSLWDDYKIIVTVHHKVVLKRQLVTPMRAATEQLSSFCC